jgi:hypothetical protein
MKRLIGIVMVIGFVYLAGWYAWRFATATGNRSRNDSVSSPRNVVSHPVSHVAIQDRARGGSGGPGGDLDEPTIESSPPKPQALPASTPASRVPVVEEPVLSKLNLNAGSLTLPFAFADSNLSREEINEIARDLQVIYGQFTSTEEVKVRTLPTVRVNGTEIRAQKLLNFKGTGAYQPKAIAADFGYTGIVDGRESILIGEPILLAYREAFEHRRKTPAPYSTLKTFAFRLNQAAAEPVPRIPGIYAFDIASGKAPSDHPTITPQEFVQNFGGRFYREPSVLDIDYGPRHVKTLEGKLTARLYRSANMRRWEALDMVYDTDQWKFIVGGE